MKTETNSQYKGGSRQYEVVSSKYEGTFAAFRSFIPYTSPFILFLFAFILSTLYFLPLDAHASSLQKAPNNLGLVGYWSFNEGLGGGTKATDFSGNGNTGTLTGGPSWAGGKLGYGLRFDGTDDYVSMGDINSLSFGNGTTDSPFSVSMWAYMRDATGFRFVSKWSETTDGEWFIDTRGDNDKLRLYLQDKSAGASETMESNSAMTAYENQWIFITITYSGVGGASASDGIKLYINGAQIASTAADSGGSYVAMENLSGSANIGRLDSGGALYASGSIDEVRIYNRALGQAEITRLYEAGAAKLGGVNSNGLVGYWPFTECSGLRAADFSGQGNTGTLTGGPTWGTGRLGCGVTLDGTNDYVDVSNSASNLIFDSPATVSIWMKPNFAPTSLGALFGISDGTTVAAGSEYLYVTYGALTSTLSQESIGIHRALGPNGSDSTLWGVNDNANYQGLWTHVVVVFGPSTWTVYVNGVAKTLTQADSYFTGNTQLYGNSFSPKSKFVIGATVSNVTGSYFNGSLDDVRIYNRALAASEITAIYASGVANRDPGRTLVNSTQKTQLTSGLVGYWGFNGQDTVWSSATAATTRDISDNGNTGTLTNMSRSASPVAGRVGQALTFDGSNDYVTAGGTVTPTGAKTISFWMKSTQTGEAIIYDNANGASTTNGVFIDLNGNGAGKIWAYLAKSTAGVPNYSFVGNVTVNDGVWHHIVHTWDGTTGSGGAKLYVDGVVDNTATALTATEGTPTNNLRIGAISGGSPSLYFNGSIDEVRIYNRALSANEVKQLYNLGK